MPGIRVLVVEDGALLADALTQLFHTLPNVTVVGHATSQREVLVLARETAPTLVSFDLRIGSMPGDQPHANTGLDTLRALRMLPNPPSVLVISALPEEPWLRLAAEAGASGFINKDASSEMIVAAVNAISAGLVAYTDQQVRRLQEPRPSISLREHQVLLLLAEGMSNQEIAASLGISVGTVRKHVENLCGALGAHTRGQVVAAARRLGLIRELEV